ncbi:MAG: hybrid sensor histidine kinase/response regulator [Desulfobacterales bacterium]|nr:hybrid sensor histidine kinase/response regulator [Desulfobacterales bacterium]
MKQLLGKILIVDDNPQNIDVLYNHLLNEGYHVLVAPSGDWAIKQLYRMQPDLILLDIMMPGMDGFETAHYLNKQPEFCEIPIIFMTALSETTQKLKGFELGAVDYITKPFHKEEVLARINTHMTLIRQKKRMAELNAQLAEANATKDKFFSIIAHDLRGLFQPIMFTSQLLMNHTERFEQDKIIKFSQTLFESATRVQRLMENLLTWARVQRGNMEHKPKLLPLKDICTEVLSLYKEKSCQKQIILHECIAKDMLVYADQDMLHCILRNLVSNSLKFTYTEGHIEISTQHIEKNNQSYIQVNVKDTGVGIAKEDMDKLFRVDVKYSNSGTNNEKGTGLGLILCKELVEKQNGEIGLHSILGQGTTVWLTLPSSEYKLENLQQDGA